MRYGMPWQGSKSRIAEQLVAVLPSSHTLVDLFAGGCAVTHAALLSGKWESIIANDRTDSVKCFFAAINGEFDGYTSCPTREEWKREREDNIANAIIMSFANSRVNYLWSEELERIKRPASKMLMSNSLWERYSWYAKFCAELASYIANSGQPDRAFELQSMEGIHLLQDLERLQRLEDLERLQRLQTDYRLVDVPDGATVYADPPYRETDGSSTYGEFDFDAFDMWLAGVDFPVFVSEFDAPPGCVEVASFDRVTSMAASATTHVTERLFVQERFADAIELEGQMALDWSDA